MLMFSQNQGAAIAVERYADEAVFIAAENLARDIEASCGCKVTIQNEDAENPVIYIACAGQMDEAVIPREVVNEARSVLFEDGKPLHESYLHYAHKNTLYIIGQGRRGTIYGIYELSRMLGVSPWYYFADVPVKKHGSFSVPDGYKKADFPGVAYRGIFLNDEEELEAWAKKFTKDKTIGPELYAHIFELLLRLKANYIWPAMHVNYFNENPENAALANRMGIIVGTSHCDMLLRSNQNEWQPWLKKKGYKAQYDYSIRGKNREILKEYWCECVEDNKDYDVCYTVGMRGIHDTGFVTREIDMNGSLSPKEKTERKIKLLSEVIKDQQALIQEVIGKEKAEFSLQTFIPYKEVLDLYDGGLDVPENVTLMWVDDNFGYMRRYPTKEEAARRGGNGLYYHASYWAFPGMSYLFFNSNPLSQMGNELKKCWESGIRKIWVLNVGALKPLEIDTEYFLTVAWEAGKEKFSAVLDSDLFMANWISDNFSVKDAGELAAIYNDTMQALNVCKPEHMRQDMFSQTSYGNEALSRLARLKDLYDRCNGFYLSLPDKEKDAFFETILMKIHAAYYINASFYCADRSAVCYDRGAMQAADRYTVLSRNMDFLKRVMLYHYNNVVANGKWNGILTPESFSPPPTALFPAAKPALVIGEPALGAWTENDGLLFLSDGALGKAENTTRFIELFNKGSGSVSFSIEAPEWLTLSEKQGTFTAEHMVLATLNEKSLPAFDGTLCGTVKVKGTGLEKEIKVSVKKEKRTGNAVSENADGCIILNVSDGTVKKDSPLGTWRKIARLGRYAGDAMEAFIPQGSILEKNTESAPRMDFAFESFSEGSAVVELYRYLTLRPKGKIRLAVSLDGATPVPVSSDIRDEWKGSWRDAVMQDGEKLAFKLKGLSRGTHTLSVYALDNYITLSKIVLYTAKRKPSLIGPALSCPVWNMAEDESLFTGEEIPKIYKNAPSSLPALPVLIADKNFWNINRLYVVSDARNEGAENKIIHFQDSEKTKDRTKEFGKGFFTEKNGSIAIEAAACLEESEWSCRTQGGGHEKCEWEHTQSECDGRRGLAMFVRKYGKGWEGTEHVPCMNYKINVREGGNYHVWLLVKFDDDRSDSSILTLDGERLNGQGTKYRDSIFTYSMKQRWNWQHIAETEIKKGKHELSVYARESGFRIARIFITKTDELPPTDERFADYVLRKK